MKTKESFMAKQNVEKYLKEKAKKYHYLLLTDELDKKLFYDVIYRLNCDDKTDKTFRSEMMKNIRNFKEGKEACFWQGTRNEYLYLMLNLAGVPLVIQEKDKHFMCKVVKQEKDFILDKKEIKEFPKNYEQLKIEKRQTKITARTKRKEIELKEINRFVMGDIMYEMKTVSEKQRAQEYNELYKEVSTRINNSPLPTENKTKIQKVLEENIINSTKSAEKEKER